MIPEDEDGDNGVVYSEDEFEEEIIVNRKGADNDSWEDVDSQKSDDEDYDDEVADVMEDDETLN